MDEYKFKFSSVVDFKSKIGDTHIISTSTTMGRKLTTQIYIIPKTTEREFINANEKFRRNSEITKYAALGRMGDALLNYSPENEWANVQKIQENDQIFYVPVHHFYLGNINIDSRHRDKGLGTALLQRSLEVAEEENFNTVLAHMAEDGDSEARERFYRERGFEFLPHYMYQREFVDLKNKLHGTMPPIITTVNNPKLRNLREFKPNFELTDILNDYHCNEMKNNITR